MSVSGQYPNSSINLENKEEGRKTLLKELSSKLNINVQEIIHTKTYNTYFPHCSHTSIKEGYPWIMFSIQGENKMWFTGASVTMDITRAIINYNHMLLDQYDFDNICGILKDMLLDGMSSSEVSANIQLLKASNDVATLYVEDNVLNQTQVLKYIEDWNNKADSTQYYGAIIKLTDGYNNQHAILLKATQAED